MEQRLAVLKLLLPDDMLPFICKECGAAYETSTNRPSSLPCCNKTLCEDCVKQINLRGSQQCPFCFRSPFNSVPNYELNQILE